MTISSQNKELQDTLYYHIWFEYCMNYEKLNVRDAYQSEKEKRRNAVNAEELRALGYSEEDIANAQLE